MFRTMQMTIYLALPIVFAVGCKPRILGSGSEETRTHDVASFNELRIGGDWEITVAAGDDQKVQVSTDDNLHQHISVKNRGGIPAKVTIINPGVTQTTIALPDTMRVNPSEELQSSVNRHFGQKVVQLR